MLKACPFWPIECTLSFQKMPSIIKLLWVLATLLLHNVPLAQSVSPGIPRQFRELTNPQSTGGYHSFPFNQRRQHDQMITYGDILWHYSGDPYDTENPLLTLPDITSHHTNLSNMFETGRAFHEDGAESLGADLIEMSARGGYAQAASYLGRLYLEGSGRPANPVRALEWFTEAAFLNAGTGLAFRRELGRGLPSSISALEHFYGPEIHDWYRDTRQSHDPTPPPYQEQVSDEDILAKIRIADIFFKTGESIDDKSRAYELYREAADEGSLEAMTKAGKLLMEGIGVETDRQEALELWQRAGRQGYAPAILEYGLALRDGTGISADHVGAQDHLRSAQDRGVSVAGKYADNLVVKHCRRRKPNPCRPVPLLYATTRKMRTNVRNNALSFDSDPGDRMHFGRTWRLILSDHESTHNDNWWKKLTQFLGSRSRVKIRYNDSLSEKDFLEEIVGGSGIMLFIHGYNNSFDDAARSVAPFVYHADLDLIPVIYSWPSLGTVPGYLQDLDRQRADCGNLVEFLEKIAETRNGKTDIRIVAHSMGSELLFSALTSCLYTGKRYTKETDSKNKSFGNIAEIVLAAPDISVTDFRNSIPAFVSETNRVTIYTSERDIVLALSEWIRGRQPRLGHGGYSPIEHDKVQTIEVADSDMRHAYVFQDDRVIHDIKETFNHEHDGQGPVSPDCRSWPLRDPTDLYWKIESGTKPPPTGGRCFERAPE